MSAGDFDFVKAVVEEDARPGMIFKTDMRPGKPQVFGLFDGVGGPYDCFHLFLSPWLPDPHRSRVMAPVLERAPTWGRGGITAPIR